MRPRPAYTLIELLVATASASVLVVGLSAALFVSAKALNVDEGASIARSNGDAQLNRLLTDVGSALRFTERSPTALAFSVPDFTGDDQPETLRYAWSGTPGDPLTRSINGSAALPLVRDVRSLSFAGLEQVVAATDVTVAPDPPWPIVESFASQALSSAGVQVTIAAPLGIVADELLLATVVVRNDRVASLVAPIGWSLLQLEQEDGKVTLGVWWKRATASEPATYQWTWAGNEHALGWILRISNQYAGNPITAFAAANGKSKDPVGPATSSTLDNSLVVRVGGFHDDDITVGAPGLAGHTPVLMQASSNKCSGGCGYRPLKVAGLSGESLFALTAAQEYRTLTVIVAPKQ
ncbi:hypothetical protein [Botrimarina hoheduenensis]|uniref:Uncharacterized protein n=1 Tax=Botrimarina hoheduenensis TaxID=2528000 RepID=A0A5C5WA83_9BACT|nr:hypothetical protein [Botrimarina hoheduenensis]TWT47570.1 hypothetical protein Pla111_11850 [Botrimarina hoheduenensis]